MHMFRFMGFSSCTPDLRVLGASHSSVEVVAVRVEPSAIPPLTLNRGSHAPYDGLHDRRRNEHDTGQHDEEQTQTAASPREREHGQGHTQRCDETCDGYG